MSRDAEQLRHLRAAMRPVMDADGYDKLDRDTKIAQLLEAIDQAEDFPPSHLVSEGASRIYDERLQHHSLHGYDAAHDVGHESEILRAAIAYIAHGGAGIDGMPVTGEGPPAIWPWPREAWAPTGDLVRTLTKGGSLVAAAIDAFLLRGRRA